MSRTSATQSAGVPRGMVSRGNDSGTRSAVSERSSLFQPPITMRMKYQASTAAQARHSAWIMISSDRRARGDSRFLTISSSC